MVASDATVALFMDLFLYFILSVLVLSVLYHVIERVETKYFQPRRVKKALREKEQRALKEKVKEIEGSRGEQW